MIKNKRVLAFIPARGGSKGIKNKNVVPLNGKPLIYYTINAAQQSEYIDNIILSTDSVEIAELARGFGCGVPFLRPEELAQDGSATIDAVLHAINFFKANGDKYDIFVLLQPTSPLRGPQNIDEALELFITAGKNVVSVSPARTSPLLIRTSDTDNRAVKLIEQGSTVRRQDFPEYFEVNGAIYINDLDLIDRNTSFNDNEIVYKMNKDNSIDIDNEEDLLIAEYFLKKQQKI